LAELAGQFSPLVEKPDAETVVFSLAGLSRMFGDWRQIASEISRRGADMGIVANLAIARDKTTAMLAARHLRGVTIIPPGREAASLSEISIEALSAEPELLVTLRRWGIRTLGDLGALPEIGVRERLGEAGCQLRRIALGQQEDWLRLSRPPEEYTAREQFDYPVELLEPLLFVIAAQLRDLTAKLHRNGQAARRIAIAATLDPSGEAVRSLELPLAMRDPQALLKQIQLCLEAKPLGAPVMAIQVALDPADPRVVQGGLFQPAAPEPEKLQTLLTRLGALTGPDGVGSPVILNSHRPDAFRLRPCAFESSDPSPATSRPLRLAFRYFRPPLPARVRMENSVPRRIISERVSGAVLHAAGPWRTSGEWWADTSWTRDEWDVALESQAAYRIYLTPSQEWFVEGSYD
jgi:protein ImuB